MFEKEYIITLKNFVGNFEIVAKPESIQVYDGVDIIYSLVSESDAYFIFISERGIISEYCKILDQQLAQLYFALFVKNAFVDIDFSLIPKIEALGHDSNTLQALFQQEGLSPFLQLIPKNHKKSTWIQRRIAFIMWIAIIENMIFPICRTELINSSIGLL